MRPLRVGVVGVGHLGRHHARIYTEILGANLVGVVDTNEGHAMNIAEGLGVPHYTDVDRFLDVAKPEALSIAVPTTMHYDIAKKAMQRGIHVLIEKPVTTSVEEAEELLKIASERNLILQVGHVERFNSGVQHVRELTHDPLFIQARRMAPFSPRISDVGVVLDLMIHDIDIILSLVPSEIKDISAMGRCIRTKNEDMASVQILFKSGVMAHIVVSRVSEKRVREMEITEPERTINVNYATQDITIHRCLQQESGTVEVVEHPVFTKNEPLRLELQHFISCVQEGREPMVGIRDGKRALEVCVEVLRQIHSEKKNTLSIAISQ